MLELAAMADPVLQKQASVLSSRSKAPTESLTWNKVKESVKL